MNPMATKNSPTHDMDRRDAALRALYADPELMAAVARLHEIAHRHGCDATIGLSANIDDIKIPIEEVFAPFDLGPAPKSRKPRTNR